LYSICLTRCGTVRKPVDESVLNHQARIIELENVNHALTERLGQYDSLIAGTVTRLEAVRERSVGIRDTADRIAYLFGEYERAVQQLIHQLRANSGEAGEGAKNNADTLDNSISMDWLESFTDYYWLYMASGK
jgi:hypothetical protein